LFLYSVKEDAG